MATVKKKNVKAAAAKPAKAVASKPAAKTPAVKPAPKEIQVVKTPFWNIWDKGKSYKVRLAIPGLDKKAIKVEAKDNILTVSTSSSSESKDTQRNYVVQEYHYSSWSRSVALPEKLNGKDIKVKYKDGELKLEVSKA